MASPGNRHCAHCIGALSFPITKSSRIGLSNQHSFRPHRVRSIDEACLYGRNLVSCLCLSVCLSVCLCAGHDRET